MKRFFRFLWLRGKDLICSGGFPPYHVYDHQGVQALTPYYGLVTAMAVADEAVDRKRPSGARVFPIFINIDEIVFTVDKLGRTHLPKALRERIL